MIDNWDAMLDYFSEGVIPHSEYMWIVVIIGLGIYALWKSRKMVSEL